MILTDRTFRKVSRFHIEEKRRKRVDISLIIFAHLAAIVLALFIDFIVGDPEHWPHPVRLFGAQISWCDRLFNRGKHRKLKGITPPLFLFFWTVIASGIFIYFCYHLSYIFGIVIEGLLISTTIARTSLEKAALEVHEPLHAENIDGARASVGMIVGRDTDTLSKGEVTRATVETVAENVSDGITAPLFFALFGGAPLALFYRAVNTCDSMVGYKNKQYMEFGYCSARLDDLLNLIPSRTTAFALVLGYIHKSKYTLKEVLSIVKRDARKHPSPNSGFLESAVAGLLGVRLGGVNTYKGVVSHRAHMGNPDQELKASMIKETIQIMNRGVLYYSVFILIGGGLFVALTWS
jgi:adenosylcobinamide-phosphate synthase